VRREETGRVLNLESDEATAQIELINTSNSQTLKLTKDQIMKTENKISKVMPTSYIIKKMVSTNKLSI
jgi:hypothetical protein